MSGGRLRHRLKFQRRSAIGDGAGNKVGAWADIVGMSDWAGEITPLRGNERVDASKLQGTATVEIRVRGCPETLAITVADRVQDIRKGVMYNIRHIENRDMRDRYLTLTCETGIADG